MLGLSVTVLRVVVAVNLDKGGALGFEGKG